MRRAAFLAAIALVLAACSGGGSDPAPVADGSETGPAATAPTGPAATAPTGPTGPTSTGPTGGTGAEEPASSTPETLAWTEPALGGGQIRGADFAGGDVVLWFWAPW